jgi:hypothetical protein
MNQRALVGSLTMFTFLAGCGESAKQADIDTPRTCTRAEAKIAASEVIAPLMGEIADPSARESGCDRFDNYLRFSATTWADKQPKDCWWGSGPNDPEQIVHDFAETHQQTLSKLCDWPGRDMKVRGRQILDSMSPLDRQSLENAYNGF